MKLKRYFGFLYTKIKLCATNLFGGNITAPFSCRIFCSTAVQTQKGGSVRFGKWTKLERNVQIAADGGKIFMDGENFVNRNTMIVSKECVKIGKGTTIGPNCCIYDHDHVINAIHDYTTAPVTVGNNVWIGANCVILKGVTIGDGAVIAAGCVITKDVPAKNVVYQKRQTVFKEIGEQ